MHLKTEQVQYGSGMLLDGFVFCLVLFFLFFLVNRSYGIALYAFQLFMYFFQYCKYLKVNVFEA